VLSQIKIYKHRKSILLSSYFEAGDVKKYKTSCLLYRLDNVKIGNLKRKNRDHKKVPKQDEDTSNS